MAEAAKTEEVKVTKVPVVMLNNHGCNVLGEKCGFEPETAERLVKAGVAKYDKK